MPSGIGPLFKCFGSKWSSTKAGLYPHPIHEVVTERFCGGAGYSLNFPERQVRLYDVDQHIGELWRWLILYATEDLIRQIPLDVPPGTDIRTLGLYSGQALLLKHWQRTNNVGNCWTISPWGNKPGQWTANTRARVAEEVGAVKHWEFLWAPMHFVEGVTHFVDSPYVKNYRYRQAEINHAALGEACLEGEGQIIACEGLGKDGTPPSWLPFRELEKRITSRRKKSESHHRMEYIWTNEVKRA